MRFPKSWFWADASVVLMVIGAFGPWAKLRFGSITTTISGTDGGKDGWIVFGAAVAASLFLVLYLVYRRRWILVFPLLAAAAGGGTAGYDIADIENLASGSPIDVSTSWGIYLALAGSISLALATIALMVETRRPPE